MMDLNRPIPFKKLTAVLSLILMSSTSLAGGVTVNDASVRGQSMQAYTAVADDPSAVFYNPAGLTQVHGTQIEGNVFYVTHDQIYKNAYTGTIAHSYPIVAAPTLYVSTDKVDKVVLALGIYTPFARSANYQKNSAVYFLHQDSKLVRTDLSPVLAFNLNPYISIGLGPVVSRVTGYTDILNFRERGQGVGFTEHVGILFKLPKRIRFGVTYRGPETTVLEGHGKLAGIRGSFYSQLNFPGIIASGISWQASPHFLISANYDYEMWSTLKTFRREYDNLFLNAIATSTLNSRNSSTYRLGVRYSYNAANDFMLGVSYINAAVPQQHIIPAMPDYSGTNSSLGYSHQFNPRWRLDAMYEYVYGPDRRSHNVIFPGEYAIKGNVFGVGVNYTFT
jgi:long-chain fatty acid transport protein